MKYDCYGLVRASKYLGVVEANSPEEARDKAQELKSTFVSVCHHCSSQVEDPEIIDINVEPVIFTEINP